MFHTQVWLTIYYQKKLDPEILYAPRAGYVFELAKIMTELKRCTDYSFTTDLQEGNPIYKKVRGWKYMGEEMKEKDGYF